MSCRISRDSRDVLIELNLQTKLIGSCWWNASVAWRWCAWIEARLFPRLDESKFATQFTPYAFAKFKTRSFPVARTEHVYTWSPWKDYLYNYWAYRDEPLVGGRPASSVMLSVSRYILLLRCSLFSVKTLCRIPPPLILFRFLIWSQKALQAGKLVVA